MAQCTEIKLNPVTAAGAEGFAKFEDVCLGGQTPDGQDATNDLTHLILESTRALSLTTPEPCIRIHANSPDSLLHHVAETIKDGKGFPKLLNDEMIVPYYLANGATLKEALDWNASGCCENRLINRETNVTGNGGINYGSAVEMTFRNGKLKVFGDVQFGLQTGDPRTWTSYDQVWKAFCAQVRPSGPACVDSAVRRLEDQASVLRRARDVHALRRGDGRVPRSAHARRLHARRD